MSQRFCNSYILRDHLTRNIVENGAKQHNPNPLTRNYKFILRQYYQTIN